MDIHLNMQFSLKRFFPPFSAPSNLDRLIVTNKKNYKGNRPIPI